MTDTARSIAILKPGTFTDVRGTKITFSPRDLAEVAATYDYGRQPAPIVVGHPGEGAPAYGWIGKVTVEDGFLRAHPAEVKPAFAEAVNAGRYRRVSPQLYQPRSPGNPTPGRWYLQHVGFLGGAAPAIKGLGTVSFAQTDDRTAVAVAIEHDAPLVSFAAPAGYAVDDRQGELWQRARVIHDDNPGIPFWEAFERSRYEAAIVSFAEQPGADDPDRLLRRARAIRAVDTRLTFWEAFTRARAEAA